MTSAAVRTIIVTLSGPHIRPLSAALCAMVVVSNQHMRDTQKYLTRLDDRGRKPNVEQSLVSRFERTHAPAQAVLQKARILAKRARVSCIFPRGGIQDNTVNRLLLMSSSEKHLPNVPMAFQIKTKSSPGPTSPEE